MRKALILLSLIGFLGQSAFAQTSPTAPLTSPTTPGIRLPQTDTMPAQPGMTTPGQVTPFTQQQIPSGITPVTPQSPTMIQPGTTVPTTVPTIPSNAIPGTTVPSSTIPGLTVPSTATPPLNAPPVTTPPLSTPPLTTPPINQPGFQFISPFGQFSTPPAR